MADLSQLELNGTTYDIKDATARLLILDIDAFSALPLTITNSKITANHVVVREELGSPNAQKSNWTVVTSSGSLTVNGTISGSTTLRLILGIPINA